ncbi:hypothetical protein LR48_Vigan09g171100 [Vigna angularis]|uniref:DUF7086 domain-containing protein n=1 Tax=Phaseolus angularis TaxID=3914 RepID=A0A0L9VDR2_PHAAN|nr:uncharacterized protein LOC108341579 [Vigna angularis]KAG2395415.1 uncharacterized protein HKW66_Vig0072090 [Vigna angularis]KOM53052.1 hypothetical protein LR48_Vigan09g171100 [Vigna angularis]
MEFQKDFLTLSLAGYTDDGGHENGPVTALLLATSPVLSPHTASGSGSSNNNSDDYGGAPVPAPEKTAKGTIPPPFPWATNQRARIHSFRYLMLNKINRISGTVQCKRCLNVFEMEIDVRKKLSELRRFTEGQKEDMKNRAPVEWMKPVLPKCEHCGRENSVTPVLAGVKKKAINWLFLFLSQTLGCCTIKQLKYFCKHTKNHRTASKNHLVYIAYSGLSRQFASECFDF